jgi:hypothetical protein
MEKIKPKYMSKEEVLIANDKFWLKPAKDEQAKIWRTSLWRTSHRAALALLHRSNQEKPFRLFVRQAEDLRILFYSLAHRDQNLSEKHPRVNLEDLNFLMHRMEQYLARQTPDQRKGKNTDNPLIYFINELFEHWTARGCEGASISPPESGTIAWKSRPSSKDQVFPNWIQVLSERATPNIEIHGKHLDILKPWGTLRKQMETFLNGWRGEVEETEEQTRALAKGSHTSIGLSGMALRSMATIITRCLPPKTVDQLYQLENWIGPGHFTITDSLVSSHQVAWDRYLIERSLRQVRVSEAKRKLMENTPERKRKL